MTIRAVRLLSVLVLALSACGGGDEPTGTGTGVESPDDGGHEDQGHAFATPEKDPSRCIKSKKGAAKVKMEIGENFFSPDCFTKTPEGTVEVQLVSTGRALHTFTIESQGIDIDIQPGSKHTVEVDVSADVVFHCTLHNGMEGAFFL